MSFPKYPEYKDSDNEWLGDIPRSWAVSRLKAACQVIPSNVDKHSQPEEEPVRLCNYTDVYYNDRITSALNLMSATASPFEIAKFSLEAGDVIITKDSETADDIAVPAFVAEPLPEVICGYHLSIIRPRERTFGRYIHYLFQSKFLRAYFEVQARGLTRVGISQSSLGNAPVPLPNAEEQQVIATFLDHETAKIDALIEEQQRLIELLKEKRQAVISHAVTKGLDPDAPMKDSGVEWLGEVPEHWDVVRIGSLYREAVEPGDPELPVLRVSIHHGVSDRELSEEESNRKITRIQDRAKYKRVRPGDLTYNMMRAWQGAFGSVSVDGLVSPAYVVARPEGSSLSPFLERQLRTPNGVEEMRRNSYGITDFRLRLYWDQWKDIYVAVPPAKERLAICDFASNEESRTNSLIEESEHVIGLLKERRSALISAAVTGKIDVRNWQSETDAAERLPMAAEEHAVYDSGHS